MNNQNHTSKYYIKTLFGVKYLYGYTSLAFVWNLTYNKRVGCVLILKHTAHTNRS